MELAGINATDRKWPSLIAEWTFGKKTADHESPRPNLRLVITEGDSRKSLPYGMYASPMIRWCEESHLPYESMQYGIGIVDLARGTRLFRIDDIELDDHRHGFFNDRTSLPLCLGDTLYFLSRHNLIAARNPAV